MSTLKVLFIGGTGNISSAAARMAVERGMDLSILNRGLATKRPVPDGATVLVGDIRDPSSARAAVGGREFDVVVDFVAFTAQHAQTDVDLFTGNTGQYVFIGTAAAYQTPAARLPITESTPLFNQFWPYAQDKIAAEDLLVRAYRSQGFPVTIVRPSHTYDATSVPLLGGWTAVDRIRRGLPVVVQGDGSSLWTLTHHADFAKAFTGLLGRPETIGDSFHITSDEWLTWDQIYHQMATAAGAQPHLVHISTDMIVAAVPEWAPPLLGDRTHSAVFDNSKVKAAVPDYVATIPFSTGAREIIDWFDADPSRQIVDPDTNKAFDTLLDITRPSQI